MNSKKLPKIHHTGLDKLVRYAEVLNFGDVHIKFDPKTNLLAIVAIHNLNRGPAIGGCRLLSYPTSDDALEDALRLGYMMSYKAAISNLPHGGAKAVLMKPKVIKNRKEYLESFARFVNELGGRYVTAVDSGTSVEDMDIIAKITPYVTCTTLAGNGGDPSPKTAFGVLRGIQAAVKFKLNRDDLKNIHVAIQGVGHVGYLLAQDLHKLGAKLTVSDINEENVARCVKEFGAASVSPDMIYEVDADVFSPCALGATLNLNTIKKLKTAIVAGSANNQLAHSEHGVLMHEKGMLYAPDFVVNAGGLIHVAAIYDKASHERAEEQVSNIYHTLMEIFARSQKENIATNKIAEMIALYKLNNV